MFLVHLLWCIPLPGQEGVPPANYLSLKECGEGWVLLEEGGGGKEREVGKGGKLEVVKIFIWNWPVCKHIHSLEPRLSVPGFILQLFGFEASIFSSSGLRVCYPTPGKFSALRWILDHSRPKDTSFQISVGGNHRPLSWNPGWYPTTDNVMHYFWVETHRLWQFKTLAYLCQALDFQVSTNCRILIVNMLWRAAHSDEQD